MVAAANNQSPDQGCPTCAAHPLLVDNVVAMRQTFDLFVSHAAEEHTRIRETMTRQAEEFHRELLEVARVTGEIRGRGAPPRDSAGPHPMERADDYEQRVVLQLSRRDMWKVLAFVVVVLALLVGLALVAGRDGLPIWNKTVAPMVPVPK